MDTRIIDRPAFRLIGHAGRVPLTPHRENPHIMSLIACLPELERARLEASSNTEPAGLLQVSADVDPDYAEGSEFTLLCGVALEAGTPVPDGFDVIDVTAGTWAVFRTLGSRPATWASIAREWFLWNPWRLRPAPEIVAVHRADDVGPASTDLWIPVERG